MMCTLTARFVLATQTARAVTEQAVRLHIGFPRGRKRCLPGIVGNMPGLKGYYFQPLQGMYEPCMVLHKHGISSFRKWLLTISYQCLITTMNKGNEELREGGIYMSSMLAPTAQTG